MSYNKKYSIDVKVSTFEELSGISGLKSNAIRAYVYADSKYYFWDPISTEWLPESTGSGGGSGYEENTWEYWDTKRSNSTLPKGSWIKITDASTDLGVIIFCSDTNSFAENSAIGGYINADYTAIGNYSGVQLYNSVEWTASAGVWFPIYENSYSLGATVIWNNSHYQLISTADINSTPPDSNNLAYQFLPKNVPNVGYIEEWDSIIYNFKLNRVEWRKDKRGNAIPHNVFDNFPWGDVNVHDVVCQNSNVNNLNLLNNLGTISGHVVGNYANIDLTFNRGTIFFDITGDNQNLTCQNNNGYIQVHLIGFSTGLNANNNEGTIVTYLYNSSFVQANNNTGGIIFTRYYDQSIVNHDDNHGGITYCKFESNCNLILSLHNTISHNYNNYSFNSAPLTFNPDVSYSNKSISNSESSFDMTLDITGLTDVDLANNYYIGTVYCQSSNSTEEINRVINYIPNLPLAIRPYNNLSLTVTGTPFSSIEGGQFLMSDPSFVLDGAKGDLITMEPSIIGGIKQPYFVKKNVQISI
jgi:hypothetical protein